LNINDPAIVAAAELNYRVEYEPLHSTSTAPQYTNFDSFPTEITFCLSGAESSVTVSGLDAAAVYRFVVIFVEKVYHAQSIAGVPYRYIQLGAQSDWSYTMTSHTKPIRKAHARIVN